MNNSWLEDKALPNDATPTSPVRGNQLSLGSILWVTTAVALLLGYAVKLGQEAIWQALLYCVFVLISGATVGTLRRDWKNAMFWGGLYTMLAYLAVAGGQLSRQSELLGWGMVGAVAGSIVGTNTPQGLLKGIVLGAAFAWMAMAAVILVMGQPLSDTWAFDALAAAIVGGLLKPFTMILMWFERESRQPRFLLAS